MNRGKTILSVAITLVIMGSVFLIEQVFGRGRNRAQPIIRRGWLADIVYWFTTILLTNTLVRVAPRITAIAQKQFCESVAACYGE